MAPTTPPTDRSPNRHAPVFSAARGIPLALAVALTAACAGRNGPVVYYGASTPDPEPPESHAAVHKKHGPPPVPDDIVERVALPFHGFRVRDHQTLTPERLYDELLGADAVCIGEEHDNPHDHYAELALVKGMATRAPMRGRQLGVGLEMFQRPFQSALDDFARGRIDARELVHATEYKDRWGWPFAYYRPVLEFARDAGLALLALNAPREQTRDVAKHGLGALTDATRRFVGDLNLKDAEHRKMFDELMHGHPKGAHSKHMYEAQVLWDETMAATASSWLGQALPARLLVILAGDAHCARPAIPRRIQRRLDVDAVSVRPLLQHGHDDIAAELEGYDYALIMTSR